MQTHVIQRSAAHKRAPAHSAGISAASRQLEKVVGDLSGGISARLAAELWKRMNLSEAKLRGLFEVAVPGVLQAELESSLLSPGSDVRANRARLVIALGSVELAQAVPAGSAATFAEDGDEDDALTSEEAAQLLHVSRSHVNTLAGSGVLGEVSRTAGGHRRLSRARVLAYKEQSKRTRSEGLDAMMAASEKAGLYDLEREAPVRKRKPR